MDIYDSFIYFSIYFDLLLAISMLLRVVSIILCKRLFRCLFHPSIRLLEYNDGLMDSGKSKK